MSLQSSTGGGDVTGTAAAAQPVPNEVKVILRFVRKLEEATQACASVLHAAETLLSLRAVAPPRPHDELTGRSHSGSMTTTSSWLDGATRTTGYERHSPGSTSSSSMLSRPLDECDRSLYEEVELEGASGPRLTKGAAPVVSSDGPPLTLPAASPSAGSRNDAAVSHTKALAAVYHQLANVERALVTLAAQYDRAIHGRTCRVLSSLSDAFSTAARVEAMQCQLLYRLALVPRSTSHDAAQEIASAINGVRSTVAGEPCDGSLSLSFLLPISSAAQLGEVDHVERAPASVRAPPYPPTPMDSGDPSPRLVHPPHPGGEGDEVFVYQVTVPATIEALKRVQRPLRPRSPSQVEAEAEEHRAQEISFTNTSLSIQRDMLIRTEEKYNDLICRLLLDDTSVDVDLDVVGGAVRGLRASGGRTLEIPIAATVATATGGSPLRLRPQQSTGEDGAFVGSVRPSLVVHNVRAVAADRGAAAAAAAAAASAPTASSGDLGKQRPVGPAPRGGVPEAVQSLPTGTSAAAVAATLEKETVTTVKQVWTDIQLLQVTLERGFSSFACQQYAIAANDFALIVKLLGRKCYAVEELVLTSIDAIKGGSGSVGTSKASPTSSPTASAAIALSRDSDEGDGMSAKADAVSEKGRWLFVALSKVHPDALPTKTLEEHCDLSSVPAYDPSSVRPNPHPLLSTSVAASPGSRKPNAWAGGGRTVDPVHSLLQPRNHSLMAFPSLASKPQQQQQQQQHESFSLSVLFASLSWDVALSLWKDGYVRDAQRWLAHVDLDRLKEIKEGIADPAGGGRTGSGGDLSSPGEMQRSKLSWRDVLQIGDDDDEEDDGEDEEENEGEGDVELVENDLVGADADQTSGSDARVLDAARGGEPAAAGGGDVPASLTKQAGGVKATKKRRRGKKWTAYELATRSNRSADTGHAAGPLNGGDGGDQAETMAETVQRLAKQIAGLRDLCGLIRSSENCQDVLYVVTTLHEAVIVEREEIEVVKARRRARRQARRRGMQHGASGASVSELNAEATSGVEKSRDRPIKEDSTGEALHVAQLIVEYYLAQRSRYFLKLICGKCLFREDTDEELYTPSDEHEAVQMACDELISFFSVGSIPSVEALSERGICGNSARLLGPPVFTMNSLVLTMSFAGNYARSKLYHGIVADEKNLHRAHVEEKVLHERVRSASLRQGYVTSPTVGNEGFFKGKFLYAVRLLFGFSSPVQEDEAKRWPRGRPRSRSRIPPASTSADAAPGRSSSTGRPSPRRERWRSDPNDSVAAALFSLPLAPERERSTTVTARSGSRGSRVGDSPPRLSHRQRALSLIPQRSFDAVLEDEEHVANGKEVMKGQRTTKGRARTQSVFILPTTSAAGRLRALTLLPEERDADDVQPDDGPVQPSSPSPSSSPLPPPRAAVSAVTSAESRRAESEEYDAVAQQKRDLVARREYRAVSLRLLTVLRRHRNNQTLEPVDGSKLTVVVSELNKAIRLLEREIIANVGPAWVERWEENNRQRQSTYSNAVREAETAAPPTIPQRTLPVATTLLRRPFAAAAAPHAGSQPPGAGGAATADRRPAAAKGTRGAKREVSLLATPPPPLGRSDERGSGITVQWDVAPTYTPDVAVDFATFADASFEVVESIQSVVREAAQEQRVAQEADPSNADSIAGISVLAAIHRQLLHDCLPVLNQFLPWRLIYSTRFHGVSYKSLLSCCDREEPSAPLLLVLHVTADEDSLPEAWRSGHASANGAPRRPVHLIGAYLSHALRMGSHRYYGNSLTFVFQFCDSSTTSQGRPPQLHTFRSSGGNTQYINCRQDVIIVGGGPSGAALLVNESLATGATAPCATFGCPPLVLWSDAACGATAGASAVGMGSVSFTILRVEVFAFGHH